MGKNNKAAIILVYIMVFIDMVAVGIVVPIISFFGKRIGCSNTVIGLVGSVYGVSQLVGAPLSIGLNYFDGSGYTE